jgi:hypothetical protein
MFKPIPELARTLPEQKNGVKYFSSTYKKPYKYAYYLKKCAMKLITLMVTIEIFRIVDNME